jgi:serine/threonine protein kinase
MALRNLSSHLKRLSVSRSDGLSGASVGFSVPTMMDLGSEILFSKRIEVGLKLYRHPHVDRNVLFADYIDSFPLPRHPSLAVKATISELTDRLGTTNYEFIRGPPIRSYLEVLGPLRPDALRLFTRQILSALGVLVEAGIIHRDVKEENIMLDQAPNGDLVAVLTDFGTVTST